KFIMVGPGNPVVATAGSDTILPCSVQREDKTPLSAVDMNIMWTRPDLGDALVHFYADQRDINTRQIVLYTGKTSLFKDELQNGNTSLRLTKVRVFDEGQYKCVVDSRQWNDDVVFDLKVEVIGTRPVITVEKYDESSDTFTLLCESGGWRPEPDLRWLDSEGKNLTTGLTELHRDAELFSVKRQVTVRYRDTDTAYCKVTLGHHTMEKPITPSILRGNGEYYLDFNNASLHLRHKISNPPRSNITKNAEVGVISYGISSVHISQSSKIYLYRSVMDL
ncbi:hypothetical protein NFI96_022289, partial [Prochilodus magdalenae]